MTHGTRLWAAVALAAWLGAAPALAKTITITMTTTVGYQDGAVVVALTVGNSGDEAANAVVPVLRFRDGEARGRLQESLPPNGRLEESLSVPAPDLPPGRWPFRVSVDYADANQYPFQALHVALLSVGTPSPARVAVTKVETRPLGRTGAVRVRLKNLAGVERRADVTLFVPEGLETDGVPPVALAAWEEKTLRVPVVNRTGLPGSRYPVFVAVEYDDDGGHQTVLAQQLLEIASPRAGLARLLVWIGGALVLGWLGVLAWRLLPRRAR
jgi:hypothetical protein